MLAKIRYEVFARKPAGKHGQQPLLRYAVLPESRWQLALKVSTSLKQRGFEDVKVRELRVITEGP